MAGSGRAPLGATALGERLSGFVYGTVVVLSVLVAGARAFPDSSARIAVMLLVTSAVFWLAHVYAHVLSHSVVHGEHLSRRELRRIARRESSLIEAAAPPLAALLLGVADVVPTKTAVWIAFGLGLVVLAAAGLLFSRFERLGVVATVGVVAANLGLGLILVALKVLVAH
jgi:prepilin signal peptidase PulO-like enzyme (type II secretory pathway)